MINATLAQLLANGFVRQIEAGQAPMITIGAMNRYVYQVTSTIWEELGEISVIPNSRYDIMEMMSHYAGTFVELENGFTLKDYDISKADETTNMLRERFSVFLPVDVLVVSSRRDILHKTGILK